MEGPAFKGSQRSGQFLEFVVEQSIAGNFDQLKERLIGVQLFKREPSYDTGEDAIVRVTASDVRKRLLQHYGWFGTDYEFRIDFPLGSYIPIPRISRKCPAEDAPHGLVQPLQKPNLLSAHVVVPEQNIRTLVPEPVVPLLPAVAVRTKTGSAWALSRFAAILILAAALGWWLRSMSRPAHASTTSPVLPWSARFKRDRYHSMPHSSQHTLSTFFLTLRARSSLIVRNGADVTLCFAFLSFVMVSFRDSLRNSLIG
jgi:hypothetical protein